MACDACLGAGVGELLKGGIDVVKKTVNFKSNRMDLEEILDKIKPRLEEIEKLNNPLDCTKEETNSLMNRLIKGRKLTHQCSSVPWWKYWKIPYFSYKLIKFKKSLSEFSLMEMQLLQTVDNKKILAGVNKIIDKMDNPISLQSNNGGNSNCFCDVPDLPDFIVGFDGPLKELKMELLEGEASVVLLSAAGGFGKTTLAKMLCHDDEIKGKFGNIFYVTVSSKANFLVIVQKIIEHTGCQLRYKFQNDEDAKNRLESTLKRIGSGHILLVLDDVWSPLEFIQKFMFRIPGYKVLVTSRFMFPGPHYTYKLNMLNDEDATSLFCHSALAHHVPSDLLKEIVKSCKGSPLALTVVGRSLYSPDEVTLRSRLQKLSEDRSILNSDRVVLDSLQTSVDALNEMPIVKECYLDLGSFPEDQKILATALMDMWVELYNLDEKGNDTRVNLNELSRRTLATLVLLRNDGNEDSGYCNEHYVMQHDLLRELAILQSKSDPIELRKRLIIDITGNELPNWWIEKMHQPLHARLLSISTDESFSGRWYNMEVPEAEILILNFRSKSYTLPQFMDKMNQLKVLFITNYGFWHAEPNNYQLCGHLSNLRRIRLERVKISSLYTSIRGMKNLRKISLTMCEIAKAFESGTSEIPRALQSLVEIEIDYCEDLVKFPVELCHIASLKKLSITHCGELVELPEEIGRLTNMEVLRLNSCRKLVELPESIANCHKLISLDISDCSDLCKMPVRMGELCGLKRIYMRGCHGLSELPQSVKDLRQLQEVICDEETGNLWKPHEGHLTNLRIKEVKEDAHSNLMRVISLLGKLH